MAQLDTLGNLEYQRLKLEESIAELKKTLYNYRLWDAEYDALKEEISILPDNCSRDDFLRTGREFGGSLVTESEIKILLGEHQGITRSKKQVVDGIARRVDYVQQNISVLEKRIADHERKLNAILVVEQPANVDEDGLPITDIVEELDDDGKVVKGSTTRPGETATELLDVLKKAGVGEIPEGGGADNKKAITTNGETKQNGHHVDGPPESDGRKEVIEELPTTDSTASPPSNLATAGSSAVSSKSDQKSESDGSVQDIDESPEDAQLRKEMLQYSLEEVGAVVAELEMDESGSEFSCDDDDWTDEDEDEEEEDEYGRSTRRVLSDDYHAQMRELEKKLDAKGLHNFGPNAGSLPQAVQEQLDDKPATTMTEDEPAPSLKTNGVLKSNGASSKKKKKVAFADELDIAPEAPPRLKSPPPSKSESNGQPEPEPISAIQEAIVERTEPVKETESWSEQPAKKKVSRFKSARKAAEPTITESFPSSTPSSNGPPAVRSTARPKNQASPLPLFPAKGSIPKPFSQPIIDREPSPPYDQPNPQQQNGHTSTSHKPSPRPPLANTLVERSISTENITPPDPDSFDEALHQQQIATEFYKLQNRRIHQNGGFLNDDEQDEMFVPRDDLPDENGEANGNGVQRKSVSRFMAARMK